MIKPEKDIEKHLPERRANPRFEEQPDYENIDWDTTAEMAKEIREKTGTGFVVIRVGKRPKKKG